MRMAETRRFPTAGIENSEVFIVRRSLLEIESNLVYPNPFEVAVDGRFVLTTSNPGCRIQ